MARRNNPAMLDLALAYIVDGDKVFACSAEPTTAAEATTTFALGENAYATANLSIGAGDGGGNTPRKLTLAEVDGTNVDTSGTATHVAITNAAGDVLKYVTTCGSVPLTELSPLTFLAWAINFAAPTAPPS